MSRRQFDAGGRVVASIHEAGHGVIAALLASCAKCRIDSRGGGVCDIRGSLRDPLNDVAISIAGELAEAAYITGPTALAKSDRVCAFRAARRFCRSCSARAVVEAVVPLVDQALRDHRVGRAVLALADIFLEEGRVDSEDIIDELDSHGAWLVGDRLADRLDEFRRQVRAEQRRARAYQ